MDIITSAAVDAFMQSASQSAMRMALALGGAAVLNIGTAANTVAAGDDARITGAVRYDTVTGLTSPQKAQARANIDAISAADVVTPDLFAVLTAGADASAFNGDVSFGGVVSASQFNGPLNGVAANAVASNGATVLDFFLTAPNFAGCDWNGNTIGLASQATFSNGNGVAFFFGGTPDFAGCDWNGNAVPQASHSADSGVSDFFNGIPNFTGTDWNGNKVPFAEVADRSSVSDLHSFFSGVADFSGCTWNGFAVPLAMAADGGVTVDNFFSGSGATDFTNCTWNGNTIANATDALTATQDSAYLAPFDTLYVKLDGSNGLAPGAMTLDTGWTANADAGTKTVAIGSTASLGTIATALDIVTAGAGTQLKNIGEKVKAIEARLKLFLLPNN